MMYKTEVGESFGNQYVKVFVDKDEMIEEAAALLNKLPCVRIANISDNIERDLTVYPRKTHSIKELQEEIEKALEAAK